MKIIGVAVLSAFVLTGCATDVVTLSQASRVPGDRIFVQQPPNNADSTIIVTRDSGVLGSACNLGFYIDGKLTASFSTRETSTFAVQSGEHILGLGDPGGKSICFAGFGPLKESSTIVKPGETKYFRIATRMGSGPSLEPTTQAK